MDNVLVYDIYSLPQTKMVVVLNVLRLWNAIPGIGQVDSPIKLSTGEKDNLKGNIKGYFGAILAIFLTFEALFPLERPYFPYKAVAPDGDAFFFLDLT